VLYESIDILANLFIKAHFIHGDYSEHNLLFTEKRGLITIDVSQSVQYNYKTFVETPIRIRLDYAIELLKNDLYNISKYFRRCYNIGIDIDEVCSEIIHELPSKLQSFLEDKTSDVYPAELISIEALMGKESFRDKIVAQRSGITRQRPKH
ncbi:MAG: RIO1 family regulatory kinase/ATPase domain-containing protein, partial [Candidatus Hodarchaeales archaeon]